MRTFQIPCTRIVVQNTLWSDKKIVPLIFMVRIHLYITLFRKYEILNVFFLYGLECRERLFSFFLVVFSRLEWQLVDLYNSRDSRWLKIYFHYILKTVGNIRYCARFKFCVPIELFKILYGQIKICSLQFL